MHEDVGHILPHGLADRRVERLAPRWIGGLTCLQDPRVEQRVLVAAEIVRAGAGELLRVERVGIDGAGGVDGGDLVVVLHQAIHPDRHLQLGDGPVDPHLGQLLLHDLAGLQQLGVLRQAEV